MCWPGQQLRPQYHHGSGKSLRLKTGQRMTHTSMLRTPINTPPMINKGTYTMPSEPHPRAECIANSIQMCTWQCTGCVHSRPNTCCPHPTLLTTTDCAPSSKQQRRRTNLHERSIAEKHELTDKANNLLSAPRPAIHCPPIAICLAPSTISWTTNVVNPPLHTHGQSQGKLCQHVVLRKACLQATRGTTKLGYTKNLPIPHRDQSITTQCASKIRHVLAVHTAHHCHWELQNKSLFQPHNSSKTIVRACLLGQPLGRPWLQA